MDAPQDGPVLERVERHERDKDSLTPPQLPRGLAQLRAQKGSDQTGGP